MSQSRSLLEIDGRLASCPGDIGVRGEVNDDVVPLHSAAQVRNVLNLAADRGKARVLGMVLVVPLSSGREIVEDGHAVALLHCKKCVGEVTSDESGATNNKI